MDEVLEIDIDPARLPLVDSKDDINNKNQTLYKFITSRLEVKSISIKVLKSSEGTKGRTGDQVLFVLHEKDECKILAVVKLFHNKARFNSELNALKYIDRLLSNYNQQRRELIHSSIFNLEFNSPTFSMDSNRDKMGTNLNGNKTISKMNLSNEEIIDLIIDSLDVNCTVPKILGAQYATYISDSKLNTNKSSSNKSITNGGVLIMSVASGTPVDDLMLTIGKLHITTKSRSSEFENLCVVIEHVASSLCQLHNCSRHSQIPIKIGDNKMPVEINDYKISEKRNRDDKCTDGIKKYINYYALQYTDLLSHLKANSSRFIEIDDQYKYIELAVEKVIMELQNEIITSLVLSHGDAHVGNFIYDCINRRITIIDLSTAMLSVNICGPENIDASNSIDPENIDVSNSIDPENIDASNSIGPENICGLAERDVYNFEHKLWSHGIKFGLTSDECKILQERFMSQYLICGGILLPSACRFFALRTLLGEIVRGVKRENKVCIGLMDKLKSLI